MTNKEELTKDFDIGGIKTNDTNMNTCGCTVHIKDSINRNLYKIVEREAFYKYIKKNDVYEEHISYIFRVEAFKTRGEAQERIEKLVSNDKPYGIGNYHYKKITGNTYKLSYNDSKNYRMISYDICEFDTINVLNDISDIDKIKKPEKKKFLYDI